jgi:hypothetical protein
MHLLTSKESLHLQSRDITMQKHKTPHEHSQANDLRLLSIYRCPNRKKSPHKSRGNNEIIKNDKEPNADVEKIIAAIYGWLINEGEATGASSNVRHYYITSHCIAASKNCRNLHIWSSMACIST